MQFPLIQQNPDAISAEESKPRKGFEKMERKAEFKRHTVFLFDTGSVENSGIDRTVPDVHVNWEANDTKGGKDQSFIQRRR